LKSIRQGSCDGPSWRQLSADGDQRHLWRHQWANPLKGDYEPLATLGRISFSIYLLHAVVVDYLPLHGFPPALQFLTVGGIVVVASSLTYRWIEKPFILMSKTMAPFRPPNRILFSEPADPAKTTIAWRECG
jgi:peptidoglycan/LPS O-acetylase OafA/YrhL